MNSSVPGNKFIPSGCEVYETLGGRINQTSTCTQTFLIIIVVINTITVPFTVVLNALVMIAVKMKSRLRMHKSNIALALLASTDFVVGLLMQPSLIALTITVLLDSTSSASCSFQVFATAVPSVLVSGSLIHLALVSAERFLAMTYPFAYTTLVTDARFLVASILAWPYPSFCTFLLLLTNLYFSSCGAYLLVYAFPSSSFVMLQFTVKSAESNNKLQIGKWHKRPRNNFREIKRPLNWHLLSLLC